MALITYLTRIQFEAGSVRLLSEELKLAGVRSPLIVTDRGLLTAGLVERVIEAGGLPADTPVFSDTPENPTEAAGREAVAFFHERRCDGVVGLGGGSPIDLAKVVSLLATHPEPLEQYAVILGGLDRITSRKPPVVAVPTTAGTGSEVGRAALITLEDGRKLGFISPHMVPTVALCDPELTLGLPPLLTAATGMDAVTHCIETYLSPKFNPPADAIALDGLRRATRSLRRAVEDGSDLGARSEMMMAALEGGMTFQKGLGAVHSISHPLGAVKGTRLHHGTINAVLLPPVLRFNQSAASYKYPQLAGALGLAPDADLASAIETLNENLGLPKTLSELGVPEWCLGTVAEAAVEDHSTASNPRPVGADDFLTIMRSAWG